MLPLFFTDKHTLHIVNNSNCIKVEWKKFRWYNLYVIGKNKL